MKNLMVDLFNIYRENYKDNISFDSFAMLLIHCGCTMLETCYPNIREEISNFLGEE